MVLLIILVLGCENTSAKNQSANKNSVVKQKQKNNNQRKEIISCNYDYQLYLTYNLHNHLS